MELSNDGIAASPKWFGLALQALVILMDANHVCSSANIAEDTNSGVTFMRRVMAPLVKANIVAAREGRDGGYLLAKPAHEIRLSDVYEALQIANPVSAAMEESIDDNFPYLHSVRKSFVEISMRAEEQILAVLREYTVADLVK